MNRFIGRKKELRELNQIFNIQERRLVSVIGRRGVGKTTLISEFKNRYLMDGNCILFEFRGRKYEKMSQQIKNCIQDVKYFLKCDIDADNWRDFFKELENVVENQNKKIVLIIDEFAWLHNKDSHFVEEFAVFYDRLIKVNIFILITGSAISWMNRFVMKTTGGLHAKVHKTIRLLPFDLIETRDYLNKIKSDFSNDDVMDYYYFTGGVPRYLERIYPDCSKLENVKHIFTNSNNSDNLEFEELFFSIFEGKNNIHKRIIECFKKNNQLTKMEIVEKLNKESYPTVSNAINELVVSDLLMEQDPIGKSKKDKIYRLKDLFCYFYLKLFDGRVLNYSLLESNNIHILKGFAFEITLFLNIHLIKNYLGRSGVESKGFSWQNSKAQIDLILDYGFQKYSIIEAKYYHRKFELDDDYKEKLLDKKEEFSNFIKQKRKEIELILVSMYGIKNKTNLIFKEVVFEDILNY